MGRGKREKEALVSWGTSKAEAWEGHSSHPPKNKQDIYEGEKPESGP